MMFLEVILIFIISLNIKQIYRVFHSYVYGFQDLVPWVKIRRSCRYRRLLEWLD